jgi:pimeloyl-ACP methyl ester carboxylesterase/DNA-binding winged helix-turn-helix (wHTH) protein
MEGGVLRFADCVVDLGRYELRRGQLTVHVEPQVFDVLAYLIAHRERLVTKQELLDAVWGTRFVSESALASRIRAARAAIGDDGQRQDVIRTVHGRGYRFVADLHEPDGRPAAVPTDGRLQQQIHISRADDGTRIAWATIGHGPPLVKAANWMTHLDYDWETPVWRHWLEGLARGRRLIRYDERGCGLSDWDTPTFGFDAWVDDLALVVDAAGLDRFPLLGVSQGAAVAVAYAVRHPERVSCLVLTGSYARGRLIRAETEQQRREAALDLELARVGWGRDDATFRQVFTTLFLPDASAEEWAEFNEIQRRSTSPANAVRFLEEFAVIDVTGDALQVRCPTLLLHARDDMRQPLAGARELAGLIPGSRLVPLDSRNHLLTAREPAWTVFLDELDTFLAEHA